MKRRAEAIFPIAYFLALLPLLPVLSLWLDEILEMYGVRDVPLRELPAYIASNAGAVPLGYIPQLALVRIFGYSPETGRLPSAIFAALSCYALGLLARRLNIRWPLLAMGIFALCPVQLRYATEARTYSQAICLTIVCTLIFTWIVEKPTRTRWLSYFLCVMAGLYTQPYTVFVPLAHCMWLLRENRKLLLRSAAVTFAACLCFVPWYLYATSFWRENVTHEHIRFVFRGHELGLIAHELVGAGYLGTAILIAACVLGLTRGKRNLWVALIAVPFLGPIAADAAFGYFFASRQLLFILPPLCALAAAGISALADRNRLAAASLVAAIAIAWIAGDIRWFTKPREDWNTPSTTLMQNLKPDECALFVPASSQVYFTFFDPGLARRVCGGSTPTRVWLAVSPYDASPEYERTVNLLRARGYQLHGTFGQERPQLELFAR